MCLELGLALILWVIIVVLLFVCPILFFIGALILCSPLGILFIALAILYAVFNAGGMIEVRVFFAIN